MLTSGDLKEITKAIIDAVTPIRADVSGLKTEVSVIKSGLSSLKTTFGGVEKSIRKLTRGQKQILDYLDRERIQHRDEIRKIGRHLGIPIAI